MSSSFHKTCSIQIIRWCMRPRDKISDPRSKRRDRQAQMNRQQLNTSCGNIMGPHITTRNDHYDNSATTNKSDRWTRELEDGMTCKNVSGSRQKEKTWFRRMSSWFRPRMIMEASSNFVVLLVDRTTILKGYGPTFFTLPACLLYLRQWMMDKIFASI